MKQSGLFFCPFVLPDRPLSCSELFPVSRLESFRAFSIISLVVFGLLASSPLGVEAHSGATFPPVSMFHSWDESHLLPADTFPVPTTTDGYARTLRGPDCTLSRLTASTAKEHDRPATQWIAIPAPGSELPLDRHPRSSRSSLRPWVCHHVREPTVLSRACSPVP